MFKTFNEKGGTILQSAKFKTGLEIFTCKYLTCRAYLYSKGPKVFSKSPQNAFQLKFPTDHLLHHIIPCHSTVFLCLF